MRTLPLIVRSLPLCSLMLLMAAEPDCVIEVRDGDPPNEGEGEGDEGEGEGCQSNLDCPLGYECVFTGAAQGSADIACNPDQDPACGGNGFGICVQINQGGCASDADCGAGFHCEFPQQDPAPGNGGSAPDCDPSSANCGGERPTPGGVCVEDGINVCTILCSPGTECVILDDGTASCQPIDGQCASDADCGDGRACVNGQCVQVDPPPPDGCSTDADCADGQACVLVETCGCDANDPSGGVDCNHCTVQGTCVQVDPPPPPPTCHTDADCTDGQTCVLDPNSCGCPPGAQCIACFPSGTCQSPDATQP